MTIPFISIPGAPWDVLVAGIHQISLAEFQLLFVFNPHRETQFKGLINALKALKKAGCARVYIDGSYVTKKPLPGDYDACWDHLDVDPSKLDPVFFDFDNMRANQKSKYEGEFFIAGTPADGAGTIFLDFFQIEKHSGQPKGIVLIDLNKEDLELIGEPL